MGKSTAELINEDAERLSRHRAAQARYKKKYRANNPERVRKYCREYMAEYRKDNPKMAEYQRDWMREYRKRKKTVINA